MAPCLFRRVAGQHFRPIGQCQKAQAGFRLARQHRGYNSCCRQGIRVGAIIPHQPGQTVPDEVPGNIQNHQAAEELDTGKGGRRYLFQKLHGGKAAHRKNGFPAVVRHRHIIIPCSSSAA